MTTRDPFFLVLDVGTTSVKTLLFDQELRLLRRVAKDASKRTPKRGWVEQDPLEILHTSIWTMREALKQSARDPAACLGMGITNQRETTILWDANTGQPVYPAIVWEDQRTERWCKALRDEHERFVEKATGLSIQAYFSASKIRWILDHVKPARVLAAQHALRFGTVDSWLLWELTEAHAHVTDETNAARTLLFHLQDRRWDPKLLDVFGIPETILPVVCASRGRFGDLRASVLGNPVPIVAACGDQQSSFYAAASNAGRTTSIVTKVTCGTGTFISQSIPAFQRHEPFYTTLAPSLEGTTYVLEGKIARGGKQVEPLLRDTRALERFLKRLASDIHGLLQQLPHPVEELFLDGGVSRDGILKHWIETISGVRVMPLPSFDGTALGTAYLCRDACLTNNLYVPHQTPRP